MARRAAIYIRTSSETQGENSSLAEQEADCRHLAQENGLQVVHIYHDVEKYRVGNKFVGPYLLAKAEAKRWTSGIHHQSLQRTNA